MHRRSRLTLVALLLCGATAPAAAAVRVELLTMGRGPELYARFGHAALCVEGDGPALVYNFGYAQFDDWYLWRFLRGKLRFWVETATLQQTVATYLAEGRSVYRQALGLSDAEHRALAATLRRARLPENRYYTYHHFEDNCATRLRDAIDQVKGGALRRRWVGRPAGFSYRDAAREGFAGRLDILLLAELLLGRRVDRRADVWDAACLPLRFAAQLEQIPGRDGPLATPAQAMIAFEGGDGIAGSPRAGAMAWWLAAWIFAALAAIGLLGLRRRRRWAGLWLVPWGLLVGLGGALVYGMAAITTVPELRVNELLLLLWPTDVLFVGLAVRWARGRFVAGRWLRGYCHARAAGVGAVCVGHLLGVLYQQPRAWLVLVGIPVALLWVGLRRLPAVPEPAAPAVAGPPDDGA